MSNEFILPELGENIETGQIVSVLVSEGDSVSEEQTLMEIETGKATVEVPSDTAGVIDKILIAAGDTVNIGQTLLTFKGKSGAATTAPAVKEEKPKEEPVPPPPPPVEEAPPASTAGKKVLIDFELPELGEGVEEGQIMSVPVAIGDTIGPNTTVLEVETGKATVEVPTDLTGDIKEILVQVGDKVLIGQVMMKIEGVSAVPPATTSPVATAPTQAASVPVELAEVPVPPPSQLPKRSSHVPVRAAPSIRKLAREIGVIIEDVSPLQADGRISMDDVKAHAKKLLRDGPPAARGTTAPPLPDFTKWGDVKREKMSMIRKITAEHLHHSWSTIPHITQNDFADITKLEKLRKQYAKNAEKVGGKLTVTAILIKIAASALKAFPNFNASVDMTTHEIIYKSYNHIGIAVDTPKGLIVPVIRDVDQKNIIELSAELAELSVKAREGKTPLEDLQGGCFTLSNLGGIGGSHFTPIVNLPEVAILGVNRAQYQPVYIDGSFEPRLMMPLSLSYDHRVIDGVAGARFMRWMVEAIEEPFFLALEG